MEGEKRRIILPVVKRHFLPSVCSHVCSHVSCRHADSVFRFDDERHSCTPDMEASGAAESHK